MLADKIRHYQEEKKMLKNTPAGYKKEYPWLKEVDSLALANVQLNLEGAFRKFFREPGVGFPHYKSKKFAALPSPIPGPIPAISAHPAPIAHPANAIPFANN